MNTKELLKEIEGFEKKSKFANKKTIFIYKLLKSLNNEVSYFSLSLLSTLVSFYFFGFNVLVGLILHFVVWSIFNKSFIDKEKYKNENEGIDFIISTIQNHLKQKK
jgi:hypothetical protein